MRASVAAATPAPRDVSGIHESHASPSLVEPTVSEVEPAGKSHNKIRAAVVRKCPYNDVRYRSRTQKGLRRMLSTMCMQSSGPSTLC